MTSCSLRSRIRITQSDGWANHQFGLAANISDRDSNPTTHFCDDTRN